MPIITEKTEYKHIINHFKETGKFEKPTPEVTAFLKFALAGRSPSEVKEIAGENFETLAKYESMVDLGGAIEAQTSAPEPTPAPTPPPPPLPVVYGPGVIETITLTSVDNVNSGKANFAAPAGKAAKFYHNAESFESDFYILKGNPNHDNNSLKVANLQNYAKLAEGSDINYIEITSKNDAAKFDMEDSSGYKELSSQLSSHELEFSNVEMTEGLTLEHVSHFGLDADVTFNFLPESLAGSNDVVNLKISRPTGAAKGVIIKSSSKAALETINLESYGVDSNLRYLNTENVKTSKLNINAKKDLTITDSLDDEIKIVNATDSVGDVAVTLGEISDYELIGGSGDDRFVIHGLGKIDGGAGVDRIELSGVGIADFVKNFKETVSNVETVDFGSALETTVNATKLAGVKNFIIPSGAGTLNMIPSGGSVTFDADFSGIIASDAAASVGSPTLTLSISDYLTSAHIVTGPTSAGRHGLVINNDINSDHIYQPKITNFREVTINAVQMSGNHAMTLAENSIIDASSVKITGDAAVIATAKHVFSGGRLHDLDASASTGGLTMSATTIVDNANGEVVTIKGSTTAANTLFGTSGKDVIYAGAAGDSITNSGDIDVIHLMPDGGSDVIKYGTYKAYVRSIIHGFKAGVDGDILSFDVPVGVEWSAVGLNSADANYAMSTSAGKLHVTLVKHNVIPDATSINSLYGTNLFKAINDNSSEAKLTCDSDNNISVFAVETAENDTAIYYCASDDEILTAGECELAAVLVDVSVADMTIDNFGYN